MVRYKQRGIRMGPQQGSVLSGENLENCMKQPKLNNLTIDRKGTKQLREEVRKVKKIKITINIEQDSLETLRSMATKTGAPYQVLLNKLLKEGLNNHSTPGTANTARLDKLEKEVEKLKRKLAG